MDKFERNIQSCLNKIKNPDHKKELEEYLQIRNTIDKVKKSTQENDIYSLLKLSTFLNDKSFLKATQKDMMDFDNWLRNSIGHDSASLMEARIKRYYKYLFNK